MIHHNRYIRDPQIKRLRLQPIADLVAADANGPPVRTAWPLENGQYQVFSEKPKEGEVWIINALVPMAWARTAVGTDAASMERISSKNADSAFMFTFLVDGTNALDTVRTVAPSWTTAAGATANDLSRPSSIIFISDTPEDTANIQESGAGALGIHVGPGSTFSCTFKLMPQANTANAANRLPGRFFIGTPDTDAGQRVDRVGFIGLGYSMSVAYYDRLVAEANEARKR